MYVSWHVGLTTPLAAAAAISDPVAGALFFSGGVLIDSDHYVDHVWYNRNWSLARAYRWHVALGEWLVANPHHRSLCLFHSVETISLVALLAWHIPFFQPLLFGMLFHLFLDKTNDAKLGTFRTRAFSITGWCWWASRQSLPLVLTEVDLGLAAPRGASAAWPRWAEKEGAPT